MTVNLPVYDKRELDDICRRFHVSKLELFGSRVSGRATSNSDVDLLVEFEAQHAPSFLAIDGFAALHQALEECFGTKVDLLTYSSVESELVERAESIYAA